MVFPIKKSHFDEYENDGLVTVLCQENPSIDCIKGDGVNLPQFNGHFLSETTVSQRSIPMAMKRKPYKTYPEAFKLEALRASAAMISLK